MIVVFDFAGNPIEISDSRRKLTGIFFSTGLGNPTFFSDSRRKLTGIFFFDRAGNPTFFLDSRRYRPMISFVNPVRFNGFTKKTLNDFTDRLGSQLAAAARCLLARSSATWRG